MLARFLVIGVLLFSGSTFAAPRVCLEIFNGAQDSEAIAEFKALLSLNADREYVEATVQQILEKYNGRLTLEDIKTLQSWGDGNNIYYSTLWEYLENFSDVKPLTVDDLRVLLKGTDVDAAGGIISKLTARQPNPPLKDVLFAGSGRNILEIIIETSKKFRTEEERLTFLRGAISTFDLDTLGTFRYTKEDLKYYLSALPDGFITYDKLDAYYLLFGLDNLAALQPDFVLSKIALDPVAATMEFGQPQQVLSLLLLNYNIDFIKGLREPNRFPELSQTVQQAVFSAKYDAGKVLTREEEALASQLFARAVMIDTGGDRNVVRIFSNYETFVEVAKNISGGIYSREAVEAFIDVFYGLNSRAIRYGFEFTDVQMKYFLVSELPKIAAAGPATMREFFTAYFKVYREKGGTDFDELYIHPRYLITNAVLQAGVDLLEVSLKNSGNINVPAMELYFDLRLGRFETNVTFWRAFWHAKPAKLTHEEAIAYIEKILR